MHFIEGWYNNYGMAFTVNDNGAWTKVHMDDAPRKIFMTGGWDSTFRILQRILIEKQPVQPCYVVDPERWSVTQELKAMANMKRAVIRKFPESEPLLLPTVLYDRTDIKADPVITEAERAINQRVHIGGQYAWLAATAKQFGIEGAELCIEATHNVTGCLPTIRHMLIDCGDGTKRVDPDKKDTPEYVVFGAFRYAVTQLFKPDMEEIAREHDFLDILELSWFCHRPNFLGQPCGTCNPCMDAMHKGMQHRVPLLGRVRYYIKTALDPRPLLKRWPSVYTWAKEVKRLLAKGFAKRGTD